MAKLVKLRLDPGPPLNARTWLELALRQKFPKIWREIQKRSREPRQRPMAGEQKFKKSNLLKIEKQISRLRLKNAIPGICRYRLRQRISGKVFAEIELHEQHFFLYFTKDII